MLMCVVWHVLKNVSNKKQTSKGQGSDRHSLNLKRLNITNIFNLFFAKKNSQMDIDTQKSLFILTF